MSAMRKTHPSIEEKREAAIHRILEKSRNYNHNKKVALGFGLPRNHFPKSHLALACRATKLKSRNWLLPAAQVKVLKAICKYCNFII